MEPRRSLFAGIVLLAVVGLGFAGGCDRREGASGPMLVATLPPLAAIARELVAEDAAVDTLLPVGASPHLWEPKASDVRKLANARVFFRAGGLDDWSTRLLAAGGADVEIVTALESPGVAATGREGGPPNPHIWLDPLRVRDAVAPALAAAIGRAAIDDGGAVAERLEDFQARLSRLDHELREILAPVREVPFVSQHDAWPYWIERYGLAEVGVIEPHGAPEPLPGTLGAVAREAKAKRARAVIIEPQLDPRVARALADEFGGRVATANPLGGDDGYEAFLRDLAGQFRRALDEGDGS